MTEKTEDLKKFWERKDWEITVSGEALQESSQGLILQKNVSNYHENLSNLPPSGGGGCNAYLLGLATYAIRAGISAEEMDEDVKRTNKGTRPIKDNEVPRAYRKALEDTKMGDYVQPSVTEFVKKAEEACECIKVNPRAMVDISKKHKGIKESDLRSISPIKIPKSYQEQGLMALRSLYFMDEFIVHGGFYTTKPKSFEESENLSLVNSEYITANPVTGKKHETKDRKADGSFKMSYRCDKSISDFRYMIIEFDDASIDKQIKLAYHLIKIGVPIAYIVNSGGKSIHCWLCVNIRDIDEWDAKVKTILMGGIFEKLGADKTCKNPSRLSRMAGHYRNNKDKPSKYQELLYLNDSVVEGKGNSIVDVDEVINIITSDELICGESSDNTTVTEVLKEEKEDYIPFWIEKEGKKNNVKKRKDGTEYVPMVLDIDLPKYYEFLKKRGFSKMYFYGTLDGVLLELKDNIITLTSASKIRDNVKDFITSLPNELPHCKEYHSRDELYSLVLNSYFNKLFDENRLMMVDSVDKEFHFDTPEFGYVYYGDGFVAVSEKRVTFHDYAELPAVIWKDQIVKRNYKDSDGKKAVFEEFIENISGGDLTRKKAFMTAIGYMLHRYKNQGYTKIVNCIDESLNENEKGGTGKSMIAKAVRQMRNVLSINGENDKIASDKFVFQGMKMNTNVVAIDDVPKGFDMRTLFSYTTDEWKVERKNMDAIIMPFKYSPKIITNANFPLSGIGGAYERRLYELEFSSFYGSEKTPEDVHGHLFFDDWDKEEWARFDKFMLTCLGMYVNDRKIQKYKKVNSEARNLLAEIPDEDILYYFEEFEKEYFRGLLFDWSNGYYKIGKLWDDFHHNNKENPYGKTNFGKLFQKYCLVKGFEIEWGKNEKFGNEVKTSKCFKITRKETEPPF